VLVPALSPGDIVLIDNLASHTSPKIRKGIEAEGAELRTVSGGDAGRPVTQALPARL